MEHSCYTIAPPFQMVQSAVMTQSTTHQVLLGAPPVLSTSVCRLRGRPGGNACIKNSLRLSPQLSPLPSRKYTPHPTRLLSLRAFHRCYAALGHTAGYLPWCVAE